jgi:hypothetical protein
LFTPNSWCGPSCGERYWGDFYSDPPDCWDPCDHCGNYTGGGCHNCGGSSHPAHAQRGYIDDGAPVADGMDLAPQADRTNPGQKPTPAQRKPANSNQQ